MTLIELISIAVRKALSMQRGDGAFPAGHNGPYLDPETPVRNTAHWLYILAHFSKESQDEESQTAAHRACDYLLSRAARPMQASFYCRTNPEKDFCNGLMGQAWAMEGLIAAAKQLGREDALEAAREVFFMHPWLEKIAIWRRVAVDGSYLPPDVTFNHQLWFAAIASNLGDLEASRRSKKFLDDVGQHVQLYGNGVVHHQSRLGPLSTYGSHGMIGAIKGVLSEAMRLRAGSALYSKSVGYHSFNLYAFAMLKKQFHGHPFWYTAKFAKMLRVAVSDQFVGTLDRSAYGWPYNPSGIEFAFVGEAFSLGHDYCQDWINKQFERTYSSGTGALLTRDVPDPNTSAARIYEALRLSGDYNLQIGNR